MSVFSFLQRSTPLLLLLFLSFFGATECGITSQWDECGCRWLNWEAWSTCNSECNGRRSRSRKVWSYTNKPGCVFAFSTCASDDMGWDYSSCNAFCHNGGTSNSYYCSCITGFYGACCGHRKKLSISLCKTSFVLLLSNLYMLNIIYTTC